MPTNKYHISQNPFNLPSTTSHLHLNPLFFTIDFIIRYHHCQIPSQVILQEPTASFVQFSHTYTFQGFFIIHFFLFFSRPINNLVIKSCGSQQKDSSKLLEFNQSFYVLIEFYLKETTRYSLCWVDLTNHGANSINRDL